MKSEFIRQLILKEFPYQPTQSQHLLIEKLADFIVDPNPASVFVLKGYAGTGKPPL